MTRLLIWFRIQNAQGMLSLAALAFYAGVVALALFGLRGVVAFGIGAALHLANGWFEHQRTVLAMNAAHELSRAGVKDASALEKRLAEIEQRLAKFGQEHAEERLAAGLRRK
jgi:hypothetical protein